MRILNKRGDKVLSIYWFAILLLVAGGIFAMIYIFYSKPYDIREVETSLLIDKIADCISYGGRINSNLIFNGEFFQKSGDDFLNECNLIFDSIEWGDQQYYTEINFYTINNLDSSVLSINAGDNKWKTSCAIQETEEEERLAKCNEKSFYSIDNLDNQYIIKILAVIRKSEKNVER